MELTNAQKRLIYNHSPEYGTYEFTAPAVQHERWNVDDWVRYIPIWKPNEEFWKLQARRWTDDQYKWEYETATQLAEDCANALDHHEWLDDFEHWIWDIALEYFNA